MLSMKTLRVAFATIGSALLLGPGFAAATVQKTTRMAVMTLGLALLLGPGFASANVQELDGTAAKGNVPDPVRFASELLEVGDGNTLTAVSVTNSHTAHKLVVTPNRAIESTETSLYLRLALHNGMTFSKLASGILWSAGARPAGPDTCTYDNGTEGGEETAATGQQMVYTAAGQPLGAAGVLPHSSGGSKGDNYVVFRLDAAPTIDWGDGSAVGGIPLNTNLAFTADSSDTATDNDNMSESCNIPISKIKIWADVKDYLSIPAGTGTYSASITLHSGPDAAQAGTGASMAVNGMAPIIQSVTALDVRVKASDTPAIADVGTSPQPFLWFKDGTGNTSTAELGYAKADVDTVAAAGALGPDGMPATADRLLGQGLLTFTVRGDFSIGAFNLNTAGTCPATGSANAPSTGNLKASESGPADVRMITGQNGGTYHLCVQVDVAGAGTNSTPIPAGNYNATITRGTGTLAKDLADGVIGVIKRNGATAKLTYLTVAEKYNQRVIIVNDGSNDARYDIGPFVTEDGTTATPMSMASGMIPAGEQMVIPVSDIVSFSSSDGRRHRASATISLNADADDIQVATTQVNLEDGSTDTVVYDTSGT